jgi:hypothetical protein
MYMNLYSEEFIERLQNDDALKVLAAFQSQLAECTVLAGAAKGRACSEIGFGCQAGETLCWSVIWYTSSTSQVHIYHVQTDTNLHSHFRENLRYDTQLQSSACSADKPIVAVCFLLGNSPASEFYMPTFRRKFEIKKAYCYNSY